MNRLEGTGKWLKIQSYMYITRERRYSTTQSGTGAAVASKYSVIRISLETVRIVNRRHGRLLHIKDNKSGVDKLSRAWWRCLQRKKSTYPSTRPCRMKIWSANWWRSWKFTLAEHFRYGVTKRQSFRWWRTGEAQTAENLFISAEISYKTPLPNIISVLDMYQEARRMSKSSLKHFAEWSSRGE